MRDATNLAARSYQWSEGHHFLEQELPQSFAVRLLKVEVEEAWFEGRRDRLVRRVVCESVEDSVNTAR